MEVLMKFFELYISKIYLLLGKKKFAICTLAISIALILSKYVISNNKIDNALLIIVKIVSTIPLTLLSVQLAINTIIMMANRKTILKFKRYLSWLEYVLNTLTTLIYSSVMIAIISFIIIGAYYIATHKYYAGDISIFVLFSFVSAVVFITMGNGSIFLISSLKTVIKYKTKFNGKLNFKLFIIKRLYEIKVKTLRFIKHFKVFYDIFQIKLSIIDFMNWMAVPSLIVGLFLIHYNLYNSLNAIVEQNLSKFVLIYGITPFVIFFGLHLVKRVLHIKYAALIRKILTIYYIVIRFVNASIMGVTTVYLIVLINSWLIQQNGYISSIATKQVFSLLMLTLGFCCLTHMVSKMSIDVHKRKNGF